MGYVLNLMDPSKCSNCCRLNFQKRSPLIRYRSFKNLAILCKSESKSPLLISCYYLIWQSKITRKKGLYICSWVWYRRESLCKYELCMLLNPKYILFKVTCAKNLKNLISCPALLFRVFRILDLKNLTIKWARPDPPWPEIRIFRVFSGNPGHVK